MPTIEHIAIWTRDIERLKVFYQTYLGGSTGPKYVNPRRAFESYFLSFQSGARLELMQVPELLEPSGGLRAPLVGYAHLALSVGSEEGVDTLTARLRAAGCPVLDGPRRTGDGYYESLVLDPDGNRIEITV
jgi:lactoylglutathione lyase